MKPSGDSPIGALWYRGVMAPCDTGLRGLGAAINSVNFAIVLPIAVEGARIQVSSGGQVLSNVPANEGLNYNAVGGMVTGPQKLEILDQRGTVIASASAKWMSQMVPRAVSATSTTTWLAFNENLLWARFIQAEVPNRRTPMATNTNSLRRLFASTHRKN